MAENRAVDLTGDDDEDEDLRIAIALSLGQDPGKRSRRGARTGGVIDLTGEDDNDDDDGDDDDDAGGGGNKGLDDAVLVEGADREKKLKANSVSAPPQPVPTPAPQPASAFTALGLDRKKMEEERLARLGKRKVAQVDDAQPPARASQRLRVADPPGQSASIPSVAAASVKKETPAEPKMAVSNPTSSSSDGLPFPQGVVKKTWAFGQPRQGDDIKIEDVFQKQHLQLAVLSSYQWDEEWLLRKIDLARTKLILVAFAADEKQKEEMRANVPRERIRFCFPPMLGVGAMHSKLMLLKYEGYMRIVVPTGNLMSFDWGETGTMENMVFLIDLPKLTTAEEREAQKLTPFAEELFYFLGAQGLDEKLIASLKNYDFAETERYQFVHTIAGSHTAENAWRRTGYCGLGRAVNAIGLGSPNPIDLDFVCASLGAVNYSLLMALYYACQGDSGLKEFESRTAAGKGRQNSQADEAISTVKAHMRIFFPSRETVLKSKGGKNSAGTICFQSKWWQAPTFPRELLRDCKSVRPGVLMHSKIMFVRPHDTNSSNPARRCFAYVGSANLSESAWGKLVRDRASGKPKLTCRNWECGVLIPVDNSGNRVPVREDGGDEDVPSRADQLHLKAQGGGEGLLTSSGEDSLRVFEEIVPVPMEWPGRELDGDKTSGGSAAANTPWFYTEG